MHRTKLPDFKMQDLSPLLLILMTGSAFGPLMAQASTGSQSQKSVPEIIVVGNRLTQQQIPGSAAIIDRTILQRSQVFSVNEALRKVPGVLPRDEEGAGLRPNIGIRGLNPTRSSKVLLLEDGIPLAYAPYGDNASYFHPALERYQRIEVLKGSSQIAFGPNTVGGVVNYITPNPPDKTEGFVVLRGGNRDFREGMLNVGGTYGDTGLIVNALHKQTDGSRKNLHFNVTDLSAKAVQQLTDNQALTVRISWFQEDSQITYSGLTAAEYAADPRANPFANDEFHTERVGASLMHRIDLAAETSLTTTFYGTWFDRDWWRQSSNSAQRPNDSSDPNCRGLANLNTTCGNEGRLREYYTAGIEPRLSSRFTTGAVQHDLLAGVRVHWEDQDRRQVNGDTPFSRIAGTSVNAGLREDNRRGVTALSGFLQDRLTFGSVAVTPGIRVEHIEFERENRLSQAAGQTELTEYIPGLGVSWPAADTVTLFAGVHRGFAPPRVEDIITNAGGTVDLGPEQSWNWEAGVRATPLPGLSMDAALFRMDFENQIVPSSVAGGVGAALTSAGETLHQGLEASLRLDSDALFNTGPHNIYVSGVWTWVADAEFVGRRFSGVSGSGTRLVTGNRLPYAPEHLFAATLGYAGQNGLSGQVEVVYTGSMFTDDLNTVAVTADGQRGRIDAHTLVNMATSYAIGETGFTLMGTVKNVFDRTYVVDRSRGTIPGSPRLIQVGFRYQF